MAVNDVEFAEATGKSFRIALAQKRRFALPIERNFRIEAGVNVDAMRVNMHQPELIEPGNMSLWHP